MSAAGSVLAAAGLGRSRWRQTRCRLYDLEVDAEIAEVRRRVEEARAGTRRHDVVNAFTAVEGAATILARETLTSADRSTLAAVLGSGLTRLRGLVVAGPDDHQVALAEATGALVEQAGWHDRVRVEVAPDLVVAGSPGETAEAVRQLVTYAFGRAPSMPVTVRAARRGDRIELWVDDHGRQLTARQRREIMAPDLRRPGFARHDPVGGLRVAVGLARAQGGYVRVEARPGGGESFGISWPAPVG